MYFEYGEIEIEYLKKKDKALKEVIEKIGHINRKVNPDIFSSLVHSILSQQISSKARDTIWENIKKEVGDINPDTLLELGADRIQKFGTSFRKADYIIGFAEKVKSGELDLESLKEKSDEEVISELSSIKGVGIWTAEMTLLFSMQRKNIFSYRDLAIVRGLRMVYRHKEISKERFERYRKRFSPYCSIASLYFWEVSSGAIPELEDRAKKINPIKK